MKQTTQPNRESTIEALKRLAVKSPSETTVKTYDTLNHEDTVMKDTVTKDTVIEDLVVVKAAETDTMNEYLKMRELDRATAAEASAEAAAFSELRREKAAARKKSIDTLKHLVAQNLVAQKVKMTDDIDVDTTIDASNDLDYTVLKDENGEEYIKPNRLHSFYGKIDLYKS
jgi:hypothetical protein